ncbi:hypothetical protein BOTBODRAFT_166340 [Botryobasidium botryosum FD-172 SS1]|uniref:Lysophospholipase n=1 Tax=Botryobasidium botryosum (strain FD-172 SS1) TaxID=930990 RepID=A0A067M846_BOTB1|nr:hypothetical protein BOTBODRAFT_166340 [Botryobasidium botryosum FD-172 SS1]
MLLVLVGMPALSAPQQCRAPKCCSPPRSGNFYLESCFSIPRDIVWDAGAWLRLVYMIPHLLALGFAAVAAASYAPGTNVQCPPGSLLRSVSPSNQTLHPQEVNYLGARASGLSAAWKSWIKNQSAIGYDLATLGGADGGHFPKVGIAVSGGGFRAAQYGAGVISALDGRNDSAVSAGTGGLLQVASYMSGLSGGSWFLSSLTFYSFPTLYDLVLGNLDSGGSLTGWLLDADLFIPANTAFAMPPNPIQILGGLNDHFYDDLFADVMHKAQAGFQVSITDPWTRALSYHFLNGTNRSNFFDNSTHGAGILWSSIPQIPAFQSHSMPYPLVVADSLANNRSESHYMPLWSTVYEFSPYEMGSWDPQLSTFMNVQYAGTHLNNGTPASSKSCVTGFDQTGFVFGTSSSLFNAIIDNATSTIEGFDGTTGKILTNLVNGLLEKVGIGRQDVANWPNPFQGINPGVFQHSMNDTLPLIDGGLNFENVPLGPLMVKARGVDFIVAVDGSADDNNSWPVGEALYATFNRTLSVVKSTSQAFPPIPANPADFTKYNLNQRPTLLGCDPKQNPPEWPLILYLPNSPPVDGSDPVTNTGTFKLQYTKKHTTLFLDAAHRTTTSGFVPGEKGADPHWGLCVQCAALDRARYKSSPVIPRSSFCQSCFSQYCYDPSSSTPPGRVVDRKLVFVDPDPQGEPESFFQLYKVPIIVVPSVVGALILACVAGCCLRRHRQRKARRYQKVAVLDDEPAWNRAASMDLSRS